MSSTNREVLEALRIAFPQLFTRRDENGESVERLDLEKIRLLAGEGNYSDRYGLRWEDKPERFETDSQGKLPSLRHVKAKSISSSSDTGAPAHVLIQGDNYHALKVLAYTHERSVDVIYIDPPYNTGNQDFKYNDRFVDKDDGYRHSKWLSFMAKRLRLAKTLLKESGVLLISIDDNEVSQLRLLCDELLGEENFVSSFIWNGGRKNNSRFVSNGHEYMLIYAKNQGHLVEKDVRWRVRKPGVDVALAKAVEIWDAHLGDEAAATKKWQEWLKKSGLKDGVARYKWLDKHVHRRGPVRTDRDISSPGGDGYDYPVIHPKTGKPCALSSRGWGYSSPTMDKLLSEDRIHFGADEMKIPSVKAYLGESADQVLESVFQKERQAAAKDLEQLGLIDKFPYPKDLELLRLVLRAVAPPNALIVDFFAGSGTTGHAVMQLNAEDGDAGKRQFILVTNDEGTFFSDPAEAKRRQARWNANLKRLTKQTEGEFVESGLTGTSLEKAVERQLEVTWADSFTDIRLAGGICTHVTYPRLKKVIEGYTTPKGKNVAGLGGRLEFFETSFIPVPESRNQLQVFLRYSSALMQLKAGCFTPVETRPEWTIHTNGKKHLCVLFDDCAVEAAFERLCDIAGPVDAYVFAYDDDDDSVELFSKLPNVTVQEVPQPLLDLFFRIKD